MNVQAMNDDKEEEYFPTKTTKMAANRSLLFIRLIRQSSTRSRQFASYNRKSFNFISQKLGTFGLTTAAAVTAGYVVFRSFAGDRQKHVLAKVIIINYLLFIISRLESILKLVINSVLILAQEKTQIFIIFLCP